MAAAVAAAAAIASDVSVWLWTAKSYDAVETVQFWYGRRKQNKNRKCLGHVRAESAEPVKATQKYSGEETKDIPFSFKNKHMLAG